MGKRIKKLTRALKVSLHLLTEEFRSAAEIGLAEEDLNTLIDHGLARSILEVGELRYRITADGRSAREAHQKKGPKK